MPVRSRLMHDEEEDEDYGVRSAPKDREISLGTTMLLGIFFALALLCAVFFGFGYSLGTRHLTAQAQTANEAAVATNFSSFKPSPGSPLGSSSAPAQPRSTAVTVPYPAPEEPSAKAKTPPPAESTGKPAATVAPPAATVATPVVAPAPARPVARLVAASGGAAPAILPAIPAGAASAVVQIAAVSHQEDADLLISTLKRRGYNVAIHQEPQDKLLHVQIGPFPSRKEADAMRQRLLADGFNAIVK
ncbi:hypothetical protein FTO74_17485 [Granulicella sp. WH15]|uniref:SPOR domain-containing protein n=1 Tax=Granulicella sp. WH15 TaxID=2602070 RepID=UPI001366EBA3|nr:SPOR domain-containing protein [Granulicella sp. WH15]QHN04955.1 hypothetical protein FTO74_17485 [Granulicella sp. WH15]